ncbi:MAG: D-sedoheptulose 7-phosphate isomerase [Candidatus Electrothrix aestuarii]|uniref:Phosphoheptose isomerase n=1 Tax=Candidatus Electrothrix aestuarii TaxID=3062594 RepID=A0AAU8M125_9BACT|nr:D-sedoheptulose 7-phosphate isomerase [Candidatus Electrothrix aestuarii]
MNEFVYTRLSQSTLAKEEFAKESSDKVIQLSEEIVACFNNGGKLLLFGNGGSAADAQHVAAEFVNRFLLNRRPLPAIALSTDTSVLTAIGNDFSYELIFAKQIEALGNPGDIALGLTTSATSPNVVQGLAVAKEKGLTTVALTGGTITPKDGVHPYCDLILNVPSNYTPRIQEAHLWIEHLICEIVEKMMFGKWGEE